MTRMLTHGPSRKNPNLCRHCYEQQPPGGAEVEIAVLFADVRGSTMLGERLSPRDFAALLNRFYALATKVLLAHDAVIDKLVGDEVMALFIPGFCGPAYRERAVLAADALLRGVGWCTTAEPWLPIGAGVHAGLAYVGNVGGQGFVDFTALGDTVNTAARLQGQAQPGEVVMSAAVYPAVRARYPQAESRTLHLKGKEEPYPVHIWSCPDSVESLGLGQGAG
jgi:adenylate cyclase